MKRLIRNSIVATLVLSLIGLHSADAGHRVPVVEAQIQAKLLGHRAKELHSYVQHRSRDQRLVQASCDFETATVLLRENLACPHEIEPIQCALADSLAALEQVAILAERDCTLRNDYAVRGILERTYRQANRTQETVGQWIAEQIVLSQPQYGHQHGAPLPPWFQAPGIVPPAATVPIPRSQVPRSLNVRVPQAPVGSPFPSMGFPQVPAYAGQLGPRVSSPFGVSPSYTQVTRPGQVPRVASRPELSNPAISQSGLSQSGRYSGLESSPFARPRSPQPQGEIGRAILSVLLSELGR